MAARPPETNRPFPALLLVLGAALALRLLVTWRYAQTPVFEALRLDEVAYDDWGQAAAEGRLLHDFASNHAPGYPWLLGAVYRLTGRNLLAPRLVHIGLDLAAAVVIFGIARRLGGRGAALGSAAAFAFYWPALVFEQRLLATSLLVLLGVGFLALSMRAAERGGAAAWTAVGLALGGAALVRPTMLACLPLIVLWHAWDAWRRRRLRPLGWAAAAALAAAAPLIPVAVHNHRLSGAWSLIQTNAGMNLYIGNNPNADGTPYARMGGEWERIEALPVVKAGATSVAEQERFYLGEVFAFARRSPGRFAANLGRKLLLALNHREVRATIDPEFHRTLAWPLALPLPGFALLVALAAPGALVLRLRRPDHAMVALFLAAQLGVLVATVVSSRYRMPLAAGLAVLAGPGAALLARSVVRLRRGQLGERGLWRSAGPALLSLAGLGVALAPVAPEYTTAEEWAYLGDAWGEAGDYQQAMACYQRALQIDPNSSFALMGVGQVWADLGDLESACQWLRRAVQADRDYAFAWYWLAIHLYEMNRWEEAREALLHCVAARPQWTVGLQTLVELEIQMGREADARRHLRQLLEASPGDTQARDMLQELEQASPR